MSCVPWKAKRDLVKRASSEGFIVPCHYLQRKQSKMFEFRANIAGDNPLFVCVGLLYFAPPKKKRALVPKVDASGMC